MFDADKADTGASGMARTLEHAVAGLLDSMADAQLVFAPHGNSYRRTVPNSFAPHRVDWGFDHRAAAIRIPETHGHGARLEHRVAGSDANVYLLLAALLGGVRQGLQQQSELNMPPLQAGTDSVGARLSHDWLTATERFAQSAAMQDVFGPDLVRVFSAIKTHEAHTFLAEVGSVDWQTWLSRV